MSSRNTPSKVEPDAKRHKLDDQNESSDDDDSIIDTTLASDDTDDDDDADTPPLIDNGKSVPEDTTMSAGKEIEDIPSSKPPASKSVYASILPTPATGIPGTFVGLRGLEAINGAMRKVADKMEDLPPPMISGKFNEAHLFAMNALSTADAHVFTSAGNCSSVLTKTGSFESKFKKMVASDEAKYLLIKTCEKQIKRMSKHHRKQNIAERELADSWKALCTAMQDQIVTMRQACVNACTSIDDKNSRIATRESQQDQMFKNLKDLNAGMTFLVSQKPEVLESFDILRTVKEYLSTQAADAQLVQPFDSLAQETLQHQVDKLTANNERLKREADHDKATINKLVQLLPQGRSALISTTVSATGEVVEANSFAPANANPNVQWNEQVQVQAAIQGSSSEEGRQLPAYQLRQNRNEALRKVMIHQTQQLKNFECKSFRDLQQALRQLIEASMMGLWNPDELQFHLAILIPGYPFSESDHPELSFIHVDKRGNKRTPLNVLELQHHGRYWNDEGMTRQGQAMKLLDEQFHNWYTNIRSSTAECSTLLTRRNLLDTERWANTRNNFMPVKYANFHDYVKGTPDPAFENTRITTDRTQIAMHQGCHAVNGVIRCTTTPVDVIWYFNQMQKTIRRSFERVTQNIASDKDPQFQNLAPQSHPTRLAAYNGFYGMGSGLTVDETTLVYNSITVQLQNEEGPLFDMILLRGERFIETNFEDSQATGRIARALDILLGNFTKTIEAKDGTRPSAAALEAAPYAPAVFRARVIQAFGNDIIFKSLKSTLKDKAKAVWLKAFTYNHTQLVQHCETAKNNGMGGARYAPLQDSPLVKEVYCDHHKALAEEAKRAN
jgi:hypothetical protein